MFKYDYFIRFIFLLCSRRILSNEFTENAQKLEKFNIFSLEMNVNIYRYKVWVWCKLLSYNLFFVINAVCAVIEIKNLNILRGKRLKSNFAVQKH